MRQYFNIISTPTSSTPFMGFSYKYFLERSLEFISLEKYYSDQRLNVSHMIHMNVIDTSLKMRRGDWAELENVINCSRNLYEK